MPENIRNSQKLLIISDTPMKRTGAEVKVFEPTLREIEELTKIFDEIVWIGYNREKNVSGSFRKDLTGKVKSITLPFSGGQSIINKISILWVLPYYIWVIARHLSQHTYIHTRGPSVPAIIAIYLSRVYKGKRKYWHKYAGNWNQTNPPFSYALQRKLLISSVESFVSINGRWENQPRHIHSFENPCFTDLEIQQAVKISERKSFEGKLNLLFVGRVEHEKGVFHLIEALKQLPKEHPFEKIWFVGKGKDFEEASHVAEQLKMPYEFTGILNRKDLDLLYEKAHFFILPTTASEGFPKVIAESMAFGCIPMVTDVSSIAQYINNGNGFILHQPLKENLAGNFKHIIEDSSQLKSLSEQGINISRRFTYSAYNTRVMEEIFSSLVRNG